MEKTTAREIAETMATKAALVNMARREGTYKNMRECPFYSELYGMYQTLKIMGVEVDYNYNAEVTEITAVTVDGVTVALSTL